MDSLIHLVKIRSFKWLLVVNSIKEELERLWMVNPGGALLLFSTKVTREEFIWWNTDLIGYSDEAWQSLNSGAICRGIGGYLKDLNGNLLFIFSGPTQVWSPLEPKRNEVLFLYNFIVGNSNLKGVVSLCTDCLLLVHQFQKARAGFKEDKWLEDHAQWNALVGNFNFELMHVHREDLSGADELAKKGKERSRMVSAWC